MLIHGLGQHKTLRETAPGLLHFLMYSGFIVLFIGTLMVAVQEDLGLDFLHGPFYLFFSLTLDVFGLLCLIGVAGLTYRRYVIKPTGLDNRREDLIILLWFLVVLGSGFLVEGARIGATELEPASRLGPLVAGGRGHCPGVSGLGATESQFLLWHRLWWWTHMIITFGFLTYIGYSKLNHLVFSPLNILLAQITRTRRTRPDCQSRQSPGRRRRSHGQCAFWGRQAGRFYLETAPRPRCLHALWSLSGQLPGLAQWQTAVA